MPLLVIDPATSTVAAEYATTELQPPRNPVEWDRLYVSEATRAALEGCRRADGSLPDPRSCGAYDWDDIRAEREGHLAWSDRRLALLLLPDYPHPRLGYQEDLLSYRQALRDITAGPSPAEVVWPERPQTS